MITNENNIFFMWNSFLIRVDAAFLRCNTCIQMVNLYVDDQYQWNYISVLAQAPHLYPGCGTPWLDSALNSASGTWTRPVVPQALHQSSDSDCNTWIQAVDGIYTTRLDFSDALGYAEHKLQIPKYYFEPSFVQTIRTFNGFYYFSVYGHVIPGIENEVADIIDDLVIKIELRPYAPELHSILTTDITPPPPQSIGC